MTIAVGDKIPSVELTHLVEGRSAGISTDELFDGKKVVLFALPGAFTPTCSAKHLPGYVEMADQIEAKGVDRIICLSVNDAYVMDAWGEQQGVGDKVMMIGDGNADFSRAVDLVVDLSKGGMGIRAQRYAMVVDDGVVVMLNVEAPRAFEVSDAQTILKSL